MEELAGIMGSVFKPQYFGFCMIKCYHFYCTVEITFFLISHCIFNHYILTLVFKPAHVFWHPLVVPRPQTIQSGFCYCTQTGQECKDIKPLVVKNMPKKV